MIERLKVSSAFCFAVLAVFLQSCAEFSENVPKTVWMKYAHVANVRMFQNGDVQYSGTQDGSFWALFDICSLDVQGSRLKGFSYSAGNFFIDAGAAQYGSATPGNVNASGVGLSSQSAQVIGAAGAAFSLSPTTQYFPKQFYPKLRYRIAIFVRESPPEYRDGPLTLKYDGQPQVAAIVQNVSDNRPSFRDFYNPFASPGIASFCP